MYSCPHCGNGTMTLTRTHTVWETFDATEIAMDGTMVEVSSGTFGDTVEIGPWEKVTCTHCGADLPVGDVFPAEQVPIMTEEEIRGTAQWIIETALACQQSLTRGNTTEVALGLDAMATYAHNIFTAMPA
jgi:hypothetical protein